MQYYKYIMGKKLTLQKFIETANKVHNGKYDYSSSIYINSKTKIDIFCKDHGMFGKTPNDHISSKIGCPDCGRLKLISANTYTKQEFISNAIKVHGDIYDYSNVIYKGCEKTVVIICPHHGEFNKTPLKHINAKQGCQRCSAISVSKNKTIYDYENFVRHAKIIHNNLYTYRKKSYTNSKGVIEFKCKEHGWQRHKVTSHLFFNRGCRECSYKNKTLTKKNFISKAVAVHGQKYDYSLNDYFGTKEKISIVCPDHGIFIKRTGAHIHDKQGCPKCSLINISNNEKRWLDDLCIPIRQYKIGRYTCDGYDPSTNTVYEYYGDFWHGNPKTYNKNDINPVNNITFGELHSKVILKEKFIKSLGYNLITIWESDYHVKNSSPVKILL